MGPRQVKNVYGKKSKKIVPAGFNDIFGESSQPRRPLADITGTAGNLSHEPESSAIHIDEAIESLQSLTIANVPAVRSTDSIAESSSAFDRSGPEHSTDITADESAIEAIEVIESPALQHLKPMTESYFKDHRSKLSLQSWNDILIEDSEVIKIAEASFAEVYRVRNAAGSSILKVMNLKVPSDRGSTRRKRSIRVEDVVSEVRIMNAL